MMKCALLFLAFLTLVSGQNVSSPSDLGVTDANSTESPSTIRPVGVIVIGNDTTAAEKTVEDTQNVTTTVPPPSTTPAPPSPSAQTWKYNETVDGYCIQLTAAVQFRLGYETNDGKVAYTTFNAPDNGSVSSGSQCGNRSSGQPAVLVVAYQPLNVTYTFAAAGGDKYALTELKIDYVYDDSDLFPSHENTSAIQTLRAQPNETFAVTDGKSYRCDVQRAVAFTDHNNSTVEIGSLKFVAFGEFAAGDFGDAEECSDDFTTSDIVPIAVGCALAALVVIVLIAYLIGRRRSRQKGYQSV